MLSSCSAEKKLHRLIKKNPHLLETQIITYRDTIRDTIRVFIPEVKTEKVYSLERLVDTVYIDTAQLNIKIWTNPSRDTVFVSGKCDSIEKFVPVSIPIEVEIPVEKIVYRKPRDRLRWLMAGFGLGLISTLIFIKVILRNKSTPIS